MKACLRYLYRYILLTVLLLLVWLPSNISLVVLLL